MAARAAQLVGMRNDLREEWMRIVRYNNVSVYWYIKSCVSRNTCLCCAQMTIQYTIRNTTCEGHAH